MNPASGAYQLADVLLGTAAGEPVMLNRGTGVDNFTPSGGDKLVTRSRNSTQNLACQWVSHAACHEKQLPDRWIEPPQA